MRTRKLAIASLIFGFGFAAVTDLTELYALSTVLAIAGGACGILAFFGFIGIGVAWSDRKGGGDVDR